MLPVQLPPQLTAAPPGHWHDCADATVMVFTSGAEFTAADWIPAVLVELATLALPYAAPARAAADTAVAARSSIP
jgi:hypothetical protein